MKTIIVDDDIYFHLLSHTQEIGESASSILRRLLGMGAQPGKPPSEIHGKFDFLTRPQDFGHMNSTQRFLYLLSWAYKKHHQEFGRVTTIEGNRRKYFAVDPDRLQESGSSVNPKPIPGSPYWVITNNSTAKKCEILSDVFQLLAYPPEDTAAMIRIVMNP